MIFVRSGMFVYIMRATKHPGKFKIGISNDPKFRSWWISKTIKGDAVVVFKMELFFAYAIEQTLHKLFAPIHTKMEGSGKTEWFRPGFPLPFWLALMACVLWWFPAIVYDPNVLYYAAGILFFGFVLPGILFVLIVSFILLFIRIIQELSILAILFYVFRFAVLETEKSVVPGEVVKTEKKY